MPEYALDGCRSRPLAGYLKSLGLVRVLGRQVDRGVRARWRDASLVLRTDLDQDDLVAFLLDRYVPAPVVSPWNGGSGFHPRDNKVAIEHIEASDDPRLAPYRASIATARAVLEDHSRITARDERQAKLELIRELQARLDDDALDWLEAAVVLTGQDAVAFPPLLGTGGNDGRYDISNNYAQAVVTVTDQARRDTAEGWLRACLFGEPTPLAAQSMGHFMRDSSPVSSPAGKGPALTNPWDLVLAVEGAQVIVAGAARRHALGGTVLVAPFTVRQTAAGYGSAAAGESGRAELWLPLWDRWMSRVELETLMREARAQVGRRPARTGLDFARACSSLGVDRGISAFERYALLERAGQATLAVPVDRLRVRHQPASAVLDTIDQWLDRIQSYASGDIPHAHRTAIRRLERAAFATATDPTPWNICATIEALGAVESALAISHADLPPVAGAPAQPWIEFGDDRSAEFVVAVALASMHDRADEHELPALRDYLHGTDRRQRRRHSLAGDRGRAIPRRAPLSERLALLHRRRSLDVERLAAERDGDHRFRYAVACPLPVASAFAAGLLDDERIGRLLAGLCLLNFARLDHERLPWRERRWPDAPFPAYELLALAWSGTTDGRAAPNDPLATRLTPRAGWASRLATGHDPLPVLRDAVLRLQMAGLPPLASAADLAAARPDAHRLSAALLLRLAPSDRRRIARVRCALREREDEEAEEGVAA